MKTAIQQAIEQIEQKAKYENIHIAYGMEQAVDILKGLLQVEREQNRIGISKRPARRRNTQ